MDKKNEKIQIIVFAAALVVGCVLAAIGYAINYDKKITKNDVLVIAGLFVIFISLFLLVSSIITYFSKKEATAYSRSEKTKMLAFAAMFAALSYVGFQFFRIDISIGTGKTAFHLGNTFVVLAALFLGGKWGGLAGAVGLTIADFTSGYVTSAPKTFILKLFIGLIAGVIAHKLFHLSVAHKKVKIVAATVVSAILGLAFNIAADPIVGYFYKVYLLGVPMKIAEELLKIASVTTAVNAAMSAAAAIVLYLILRPALAKAGLFIRLEKED